MGEDNATAISVIDFRRQSMVLNWHALGGTWTAWDEAAREEFQAALETGMRAWAGAGDAPGTSESFAAFTTRTEAALRSIAAGQPPGATAVIVTSGGVISWLAAALLSGGVEQWIRLNRVCVNTGVTKLVNGRRGVSLVSFNDHSHLAGPELTYR